VDAKTGASGLISPGDLVDVILTQEFQRADTPAGRRVVAETVLTEVRVIAVDQQIAQGAPVATPLPTNGAPRVASTVTLQVTPEQAQRVAVAERLGRLSLSVRAIDGSVSTAQNPSTLAPAPREFAAKQPSAGLGAGGPVVFGSDVSSVLNNEETGASPRVRVIQGSDISNVVFR
jgi:pilus assembly protein CpaB